ncbi:unnamed protein product [Lactuca virosa]|uniref:Uncharacterized protein n=1 Tax=Lactuca virosa TaxID=75947 RepID=A0AAU9LYU1_9ASTR|nr:unnamed protein product [Lactuca virosa]
MDFRRQSSPSSSVLRKQHRRKMKHEMKKKKQRPSASNVNETEAASMLIMSVCEEHDDGDIQSMKTINLSYQLVDNAMLFLKIHLLYYPLIGYVRELKVVTGDVMVKNAIVDFLEAENMEWKEEEENKTTLRIKIDGNKKYDVMTFKLSEQHMESTMQIVKPLLFLGAYGGSVLELKVNTGSGNLKQAVVNFLEKEKIAWKVENNATLVIKFSG